MSASPAVPYDQAMNAKLEKSASNTAVDGETVSSTVRTVRYPSLDFPVPPAIEMVVPKSWRPIGATVLNEMRTRPDVAVAGPDVVGGVRPNLMAKVSRVPVDGDPEVVVPTAVLEALFARQRNEEGIEAFEYRIHDVESDVRPYGVSRYTEHHGGVDVQRLTCAVIVATGPVVHLVIVQAASSVTDHEGRSAIEGAFASLQVAAPVLGAGGREVEGA